MELIEEFGVFEVGMDSSCDDLFEEFSHGAEEANWSVIGGLGEVLIGFRYHGAYGLLPPDGEVSILETGVVYG